MFLHLDHIKDIADESRDAETRKTLRTKLGNYRLDITQRAYRDSILKALDAVSSDYVQAIAPYFNGSPPSTNVLRHIKEDIEHGRARRRVWHQQSLEDRARAYLTAADFDPFTIADFVLAKAETYRMERAMQLTMASRGTFDELVKIEFEVGQRVQEGVTLMKLLFRVTESDAQDARYAAQTAVQEATVLRSQSRNPDQKTHACRLDAEADEKIVYSAKRTAVANELLKRNVEIERARLLLQGRYYETRTNTTRIEKERDDYLRRMQPAKKKP